MSDHNFDAWQIERVILCAYCGYDLNYHSEVQSEKCLKELSIKAKWSKEEKKKK